MTYNKLIHDIFHLKPAPRGVIVDLVEFDGYVALRFYRDNFDSLPETTRVAATEWALATATNLNKIIPCAIQAWETPPEGL